MINSNSDHIKIKGYYGTWHVIDSAVYEKYGELFLLEHEYYGDEAYALIVDKEGVVILDDVSNGFEDLDDVLDAVTHW